MSAPLLAAIIGFLSALIGGFLQAFFQRRLAKDESVRRQKAEAYILFFKGISGLAHGRSDEDIAAANAMVAEGRARISLYGSKEVIERMTDAFRRGPLKYEDMSIHAAMIAAMRKDSRPAQDMPSDQSLFELLYGDKEKLR